MCRFRDLVRSYLADDNAAKADNHSFTGNLTVYHEAPTLVENFDELA